MVAHPEVIPTTGNIHFGELRIVRVERASQIQPDKAH